MSEGGGVNHHNGVLYEGLGSDQLVVGGVVDDVDDPGDVDADDPAEGHNGMHFLEVPYFLEGLEAEGSARATRPRASSSCARRRRSTSAGAAARTPCRAPA